MSLHVVGEILTDRQPCARVGLARNEIWLEPNRAQSGGLLQATTERRACTTGQM